MPITTTGLTALVAGEDWHIVGSGGGEPAFGTGWSNASATYYPKMAFRLREPGIVDLVGCVTTDGTISDLFTLPEGYRPTASIRDNAVHSATVSDQVRAASHGE